jgi:hypothetical protein
MRVRRVYVLAIVFAAALGLPRGAGDEAPKKSSPVTVEGKRLTFDPKTCTEGKGGFAWGLGSLTVTVLGHEDGKCVFDYQWEVEGAGNHVVHRVKVPTDSGPVVIEAEGRKGPDENHWSRVFTSFTRKQAKLVRQRKFGWDEVPVGESGGFAAYRSFRPGDESEPIHRGDKVILRFLVFLDGDFATLAGKDWRMRSVTVKVGEGKDWEWVQAVAVGMTPYEVRQVRVPVKLAGAAKTWLPGFKDDSTLFAEMQVVAVDRK